MPIRCTAASSTQLDEWNRLFAALPESHPLKAEGGDVVESCDEGVTVFQFSKGFFFRRGDADAAVRAECAASQRECLCSPFELLANPRDGKADPTPLLQRFEDLYGRRAKQIDTHLFSHNGVTLLLALFPSNIVREMMAPHGGILKTVFKGNTRDLRRIPALQHFLHFPDEDADVESVFATQYDKGNYEAVRALHYQIVKDVIEIKRDRGGPITLGPIGQWDA
jgi:hypothetical protein